MSGKAIPFILALAAAGLLSGCVYSYRDNGYAQPGYSGYAAPSGYGVDDNYAPYHGTGERIEPVPD